MKDFDIKLNGCCLRRQVEQNGRFGAETWTRDAADAIIYAIRLAYRHGWRYCGLILGVLVDLNHSYSARILKLIEWRAYVKILVSEEQIKE